MNSNNETQCYFVQLQIDNYLDGDLTATQQESFISHVQQCSECASEFRYAKTIQDGLVDMPLIDCADSVVESLLTTVQSQPQEQPDRQKAGSSGLADFWQWLLNAPPAGALRSACHGSSRAGDRPVAFEPSGP